MQTLSERPHLHVDLEKKAEMAGRGACAAQRRLSEAEADMDISNWEHRNADVSLHTRISEIGTVPSESVGRSGSKRKDLTDAEKWK